MGPAFTTFVQRRAARRLIRGLARTVAIAVLAAAVVYVVGANAFLGTGWFASVVNEYPETIDVHYARGWTLWPGRVHARDLSIRATDGNVEWILHIDEVTFDVSLWGLLHRRFFADHVRGTGVSLRVRQRLDAMPATAAQVANLPPIEGLPPYALRPRVTETFPVWDDTFWDLWTIRLRDVVAEHTREVWIDDLRFAGDARITGGFYLKPLREAQIGPAHADIAEGQVTRGEREPIAATLGGALDVNVDPFDPRVTRGRQLLGRVSVHALASSELRAPAEAIVTTRVGMTRGRIDDGSRVMAFVPHADLHGGNIEVRGAVAATAEARDGAIVVSADSWRAKLLRDHRPVAEADARLAARVRGGLDLVRDFQTLDVSGSRLVLTNAAFVERSRVEDRWGAEIAVDDAHLRPGSRAFEGRVMLGASDALPLFAGVLHDEAPSIVESVLEMPRLQGLAWLSVTEDSVAVRDLVARGGGVWIRGAYGQVGPHRYGGFVVDKGPLAVGIAVDDDGMSPHFFGLDDWLAAREAMLNRWLEGPARPPAARGPVARGFSR